MIFPGSMCHNNTLQVNTLARTYEISNNGGLYRSPTILEGLKSKGGSIIKMQDYIRETTKRQILFQSNNMQHIIQQVMNRLPAKKQPQQQYYIDIY